MCVCDREGGKASVCLCEIETEGEKWRERAKERERERERGDVVAPISVHLLERLHLRECESEREKESE